MQLSIWFIFNTRKQQHVENNLKDELLLLYTVC